jgi:anti-sigma B factor antagonist
MPRQIEQGDEFGSAPGHGWFQVDQMDGCGIVRAGGEIDSHTAHQFHEAANEAASQSRHVVIDLADVTFIDSTGLGALIVARKAARERGGSVSLVSPPPVVRRLLGSTRLHDVFSIHDSLAEAINASTQR